MNIGPLSLHRRVAVVMLLAASVVPVALVLISRPTPKPASLSERWRAWPAASRSWWRKSRWSTPRAHRRQLTPARAAGIRHEMGHYRPHVVRQGEYLAKLASELGFDADETWNHPRNSELREARKDPSVLAPGDVLWFCPRERGHHNLNARAENGYAVRVPRVDLRVQVRGHLGEPLRGEAYEAEAAEPPQGNLDGEGYLNVKVPIHITAVSVSLPARDVTLRLLIGHLDPHTEWTGAAQRLRQLGYHRGSIPTEDVEEHPGIARALGLFQEEEGLDVTWSLTPETAERLNQRIGR